MFMSIQLQVQYFPYSGKMGSGASKRDAADREAALNALKDRNSALQSQLNAAAESEKRSHAMLLESQAKAKQLEEDLARSKELASKLVAETAASRDSVQIPSIGLNASSPRGIALPNSTATKAESAPNTGSSSGASAHAKLVPPLNTAAVPQLAKVASSSSFSNLAAASLSSRGAVTARRQLLRSVPSASPAVLSERLISIPFFSNRVDDSFAAALRDFACFLDQRLQRQYSVKVQIVDVFGGRAGSGGISAPELRLFIHIFMRCHPHCIMLLSDSAPSRATLSSSSTSDVECSILSTAFFKTVSKSDGLNDIISSVQSAKLSSILEVALFMCGLFSNHCCCWLTPQTLSPDFSQYAQQISNIAESASVRPQFYSDRSSIFQLIETNILKWVAAFPCISNLAHLWAEAHLCRAHVHAFPEALSLLAAPFERALTSALEFGSNKIALIVSDAVDIDIALSASLSSKKGKFSAVMVPFLRCAAMESCYQNCASLLQTIMISSSDEESGSCLASRSLSALPPCLGEVVCAPQAQHRDSLQRLIVLSESLSSEARRFTNVSLSPKTTVVCVVSAADAQAQPMLGWKLIPCSFLAGYDRSSILHILASFGFVLSGSALSGLPPKISCIAAHVAVQHARACAALSLGTSCLGEILVRSEFHDVLIPVILFIESIVDVTRSSGPLKHMIFDLLLLCSLSWRGASYHTILQFTGSAPFHVNMLLQLLDGFVIQACGLYCISSETIFRFFRNRFLKQTTELQRLHRVLFDFYWATGFSSQDAALEMLHQSCACASSSAILQLIGSFELLILLASSTSRPYLLKFLERAQATLGPQARTCILESCNAFLPSAKSSAVDDASFDLLKGMAGNLSWADALMFLEYCTSERAKCCCYFLLHESCLGAPPSSSLVQFDTASTRADIRMMLLSCTLLEHLTSKRDTQIKLPALDSFGHIIDVPWLFGPVCIRALSLDSTSNSTLLRSLKPFLLLFQTDVSSSVYKLPSVCLFYAKVALILADVETSRYALQVLQNDVISWSELHLGAVHPFTVSAYAVRALHLIIITSVSDAASSIKHAIYAMRSVDYVPFESKALSDAISLPFVPNAPKGTEFTFSKAEPLGQDAAAYLLRGEWCWRVACVDVARACAALLMYLGESSDALPLLAYCKSSCWSMIWDDSVGPLCVPSLSLFLAFSSGRLDLAMQQIKNEKGIAASDDIAKDVRMWTGDLRSLEPPGSAENSSASWRYRSMSLLASFGDIDAPSFKAIHAQNLHVLQNSSSSDGSVDASLYLVHSACACVAVFAELDVKAFAHASAVISRQYGSRHVFYVLAQLAHAVAALSAGSVTGAQQIFSSLDGSLHPSTYPYTSCLFMIYCSMMSYWTSIPSLCSLAEASAMHLLSQISNTTHPVFLYSVSAFVLCSSAFGKVGAVSGIARLLMTSAQTDASASLIRSDPSLSSMQLICSFSCSAAISFSTGSVAAYVSKYPTAPQLKMSAADFASSSMQWWCQRHSGIQAGDSEAASSAVHDCFQNKVMDPFSLFGVCVYLSGPTYICAQSEAHRLSQMVDSFFRRRSNSEHDSVGTLYVLVFSLQVHIAISNCDIDAQDALLIRSNSFSDGQPDDVPAALYVAVARLHCNDTRYIQAVDTVRMFADASCMSFDTQLEWCYVICDAAKECSELPLLRSCLHSLETLKKSASESDIIFQVVFSCCCCIIFATEDKFAAAEHAISDAKVLHASVCDRFHLSLHIKYLIFHSDAYMFQVRHSYQLALEAYTNLQLIFPKTHQLTSIAEVYALEMQIILFDLPADKLDAKLETLCLSCKRFSGESGVFASLSRSKAFLLEQNRDLDKSEEQFSKVVTKADLSAFGSVNERLAWDQVSLGRLYMQRLQISLAESSLIDAIKIYIKIRGDQNSRIALILFELASVYERYGNYVQAWEKACKSIKILDRIPREGHWSACEAYLGLGKFMLVIDNWHSSLEYLSIASSGFNDLQGPKAVATLESAAFAAFVEHLMSCDSESLRKSRICSFAVLANMVSSTRRDRHDSSNSSKEILNFSPSISYARWLSFVGACNIFSCNSIAKRYIAAARDICESISNSVAATLDPLLILAYTLHGRYNKAAPLLSARIPPSFFSDSGRKNAIKFGVEHADLLHAGAMLQYTNCNYKYAGELLRASRAVLSNQMSEGLDWTHNSVKIFRIDAIEAIICSETGSSLKTLDSAKAQLDRLRLGNNHLLHHVLTASQMQSDIWTGCFSPAAKQVIMVCKDMRSAYKSSHMLNIRLAQLEAVVHVVCGNYSNALSSLNACQSSMYSGWSSLNAAQPFGVGKMATFFMRVARDAHATLGFGHRELCSCFAIKTFVHSFFGEYDEAFRSAALTQRCVASIVNSMSAVREQTNLSVFNSLSQVFISMLQLIKGNISDALNSCSACVDSMVSCGWSSDNFWVGLGRFLTSLAAISHGDLLKAREVASLMFDKLTSSSQSASMLSSCMFMIVSAFSGTASMEADIFAQLKPFLHPSLHIPAEYDADALWAFPFAAVSGAVAFWLSCQTETAQKYIDAVQRFLQEFHHQGHPAHIFIAPLSILLSTELSSQSVYDATGAAFDSSFDLTPKSMKFTLMGVLVVVDYILKTGEQQRNWLQMLHTTEQLLEELPRLFRDEGLMQLQLWFCHSEICRRLNKCADALQRLNTVEARYLAIGYSRPHLLLMQVYLAQARCLSSLGRLKDAIDIVRGCVMSFEQFGISNSLSRQFRVEFGSMLIDVGSFSEASEFFEKGGNNIMILEIQDASTLIGIGKLACYRGDSALLGTAISRIRSIDIDSAADSNSQTSLQFLLAMQLFLQGEFSASVIPFEELVLASENRFGTSHPRTCECRGLQALVAVLLGSQTQIALSKSYEKLCDCRSSMKEQGLDASSSSVVRTLLAIEAWINSELGHWGDAWKVAKSIVRPCDMCSLDDIVPVYVFLRCCLKLGLHSVILNDYSTLDVRFASAGATSHPIVVLCKFLRVRALMDCDQSQAARELFASIDQQLLPGQWAIMRLWCCAHVTYDAQHVPSTNDADSSYNSKDAAFSSCDEMLASWVTIQRTLPITHRLNLRSQFNIACARASLGSCDGVQLLQPVLLLQRQHLGSLHCDALECAVALADYLPPDARSTTDSESVVTDAMKQLSQLCGPSSPCYIRAQLVWLRLCCSRGKGSAHFKEILPSIHSILIKMKGVLWFSAFEEKQLHLLHAQALAQATLWQPAAEKLLKWQADYCKDNRLKMHLPVMQSYRLAAEVFEHLSDFSSVERQHDAAISRSFSQRHLLFWAKGSQLLQMARRSIFLVDSRQVSSASTSAYDLKASMCESAAAAFNAADSILSAEELTPLIVSFRCHCKLRAAEAFICSGSDTGLASARELCECCDALCSICEPDDPSVRCLLLRMRANILSASDSDPYVIENLYEQSAVVANSLPLQHSANMSLQSLRVSLGLYAKAQQDANKLTD